MKKVFQKPWHSFRILPNVSLKYCSMSVVKTLLMYKVCITKKTREILQRLTDFWIKKNDIFRLFECLELSESTACDQKSRCNCIVALFMLLKRLSIPCRCKDMVPLFAWNPTELRLIFTLDFLYQRHHHIARICKRKGGVWPACLGNGVNFQTAVLPDGFIINLEG